MTKPKGGRGQRAECPTTTVRIPIGLVDTIALLTEHYRATQTDIVAIALTELYKRQRTAKPTRDWTELSKYIETVDSVCPAGWLEHYSQSIQANLRQ